MYTNAHGIFHPKGYEYSYMFDLPVLMWFQCKKSHKLEKQERKLLVWFCVPAPSAPHILLQGISQPREPTSSKFD